MDETIFDNILVYRQKISIQFVSRINDQVATFQRLHEKATILKEKCHKDNFPHSTEVEDASA
jgi:hypothetical protein